MSGRTPATAAGAALSEYRRGEQSISLSPIEEQLAEVGAEETARRSC